ncbi:MAG: DUF6364 family protein [Chitinophagaceae bacterium]|nr:DUF6364 family protein [Chitinophagaceae bacterium]
MTVKLNLTIDEKIVVKSKRYAAKKKTTVSKMVQQFLKKQIEEEEKKPKKKSFVEKWAGTLKVHVPDVKKAKAEYIKEKYGY